MTTNFYQRAWTRIQHATRHGEAVSQLRVHPITRREVLEEIRGRVRADPVAHPVQIVLFGVPLVPDATVVLGAVEVNGLPWGTTPKKGS